LRQSRPRLCELLRLGRRFTLMSCTELNTMLNDHTIREKYAFVAMIDTTYRLLGG